MGKKDPHLQVEQDDQAQSRKHDHIALAFKSATGPGERDTRFYYEPMLEGHPNNQIDISADFLGKTLRTPIWVSSMTGGTEWARIINHNLAQACAEFGMGMGLGSCRQLLFSHEHLQDFAVRHLIGDQPLFANLGIAQIEQLIEEGQLQRVNKLLKVLEADGLIIHVNPLQEWLQPEGDHIHHAPIDTISRVLDVADYPIIVKEVGQGYGPQSLKALMSLPLAAIDFGAQGGTNFSRLEMLRGSDDDRQAFDGIAGIGHTATEMIKWVNNIHDRADNQVQCRQFIVSGGMRDFLDGYYHTSKLAYPAIYGQASSLLRHAKEDFDSLYEYLHKQAEGLKLAHRFLRVR